MKRAAALLHGHSLDYPVCSASASMMQTAKTSIACSISSTDGKLGAIRMFEKNGVKSLFVHYVDESTKSGITH